MDKQIIKKEKRFNLPKFNEKAISILTFISYILAMIVFEIGYCNASNVMNILNSTEIKYNFSVCRIVMYILFIVILIFTRKIFIKEALESFEKKHKKIFTYMYFVVSTIAIIGALVIIARNPILTRGMSIGIIAVLMGNIFIMYVSNNIIKNVIITSLTLGIIFSITTDFNHAIDEKKHFMTAFNIAFGNFDYVEKPITDAQIDALPHLSKFTTINEFLEKRYEPNITSDVNLEDIPSTPANYTFITYLFSAVGIFIAKTLGGSIIDLYIMGRIFNLILYTILICVAIKLIPYKKNIFAVIFLMPTALLLAASYSIDGFCIGAVAIFIAYCLKMKEEKKTIELKDLLILIGLFLLMLCAKSMAYILVGFIFFMLPIKETLKKNKKYIPIIVAVFVILAILAVFVVINVKNKHVVSDPRGGANVSVSGQIDNMLHHPTIVIKVILNHINSTIFDFNWIRALHMNYFFTVNSQVVLIPLLIFILYVSLTEDDCNFNIKDKIIMILSFLFVYGMTSMVLYVSFTEVGALTIGGYQTRYILPIVPLVLFCLSNRKVTTTEKENRNMNIAITSGIFVMLGIMQCLLT